MGALPHQTSRRLRISFGCIEQLGRRNFASSLSRSRESRNARCTWLTRRSRACEPGERQNLASSFRIGVKTSRRLLPMSHPFDKSRQRMELRALEACEKAKDVWVQVVSQKSEGFERYKTDAAKDPDAFPEPKWPSQSIEELIHVTFTGCMIDHEEHPALFRLMGASSRCREQTLHQNRRHRYRV